MSTVASVSDLTTFANVTVDETRAQQMLDLVEDLASGIVSPLPVTAKVIILTAAARALPNPTGASSQSAGGSSATWAPGGVYLTKAERGNLRRLAGIGGGAFSINVAPNAGQDYREPLGPVTLDDREQLMDDYPEILP